MALNVERHPQKFYADPTRVVAKPLTFVDAARLTNIIQRILSLSEEQVLTQVESIKTRFATRHRNLDRMIQQNFRAVAAFVPEHHHPTPDQQLLIGAVFTHEYSIEAAALFNPSIVLHPDQSGLADGEARFILSFRSTGEGHISSVEFRSGVIGADGTITFDALTRFVELPEVIESYPTELRFPADTPLSERVLFPVTRDESNGIEDVRMVRFTDDDGTIRYYGTYTAYDGHNIRPKLFETQDFLSFHLYPLEGAAVMNKGFALFPRRVNGKFAMLSRLDGERNFVMLSDDLCRWEDATLLRGPEAPWEVLQIGNCGSPIETEAGWLVLTHGVGPMREYSLGADLLDLNDPTRILARLEEPLLSPDEMEREGYVPNVLYTCGALVHNGQLVLPYAMSDAASGFATVPLADLLAELQ